MKNNGDRVQRLLEGTRDKIQAALAADGVVILPPMDVHVSTRLLDLLGIKVRLPSSIRGITRASAERGTTIASMF
jgi:hypothetical protein